MAFLVSPGVQVTEKDFTNVIAAASSARGAYAGYFEWGPVMQPFSVVSENDLVSKIFKPNQNTFKSFYTAANFLAYSNNLTIVRADAGEELSNANSANANFLIRNSDEYDFVNMSTVGQFIAKYPGKIGNSIKVSVCDAGSWSVSGAGSLDITVGDTAVVGTDTQFLTQVSVGSYIYDPTTNKTVGQVASITSDTLLHLVSPPYVNVSGGEFNVNYPPIDGGYFDGVGITSWAQDTEYLTGTIITSGAYMYICIQAGTSGIGTAPSGTGFSITDGTVIWSIYPQTPFYNGASITATLSIYHINWEYQGQFAPIPGTSDFAKRYNVTNDEFHLVIVDNDGEISGQAGTILEKYAFLSKMPNAQKFDGTNAYYKNVLNYTSQWIYYANKIKADWDVTTPNTNFTSLEYPISVVLSGGNNGNLSTDGDLQRAYNLFNDTNTYDIGLIPIGDASVSLANWVIQNLAEARKDCVVFVSPKSIVTNEVVVGNDMFAVSQIRAYADLIASSSYAFIDSGYKYQYDKYNDVYRWIPLNGDMAGLCARTDISAEPWYSPAGFTRGQVKNVVKLAFNPLQAHRDVLYQNRVNPVVSFAGQGVVLYGDKTAQAKPSAFDRINVRRLFITIEKAIATSAKYELFEFNDPFTRSQFKAMIEPYLRGVQGKRGITDFLVVCDETNNTPDVIDSNRFVASIFIKPSRSINFIELNFIATRTSAQFSEIAGAA